jgi:hypothetical protein
MGKKFKHLEHIVEKEYEKKGYSEKHSKYIADSVAGRVYRNKRA